jgi:hypothetical protein
MFVGTGDGARSRCVGRLESVGERLHEREGFMGEQAPDPIEPVPEAVPLDGLHDDVRRPAARVVDSHFVDRDDRGVADHRRRLRLGQEALPRFGLLLGVSPSRGS